MQTFEFIPFRVNVSNVNYKFLSWNETLEFLKYICSHLNIYKFISDSQEI